MIQVRFFLLALALTLTLTLVVSPALLALEPADEFPAAWSCAAIAAFDFPDRTCISICRYYDGTRDRGGKVWHCPNSSIRTNCTLSPCTTPEECASYGLRYTPCHDVEEWVCKARAVRETQFSCKHKGPPLSAVKNGDCVLRLVKHTFRNKLELRQSCWNPSDYAFAPDFWVPVHPETLQP